MDAPPAQEVIFVEYVEHHFPPGLAVRCGVDAAIFLRNIYHWVQKNQANRKHFHDGRYWTYNSLDAFAEIFPYWTKRQIERIISRCKAEGLLLTGCFNEDQRDRTVWYALTDEGMGFFRSGETGKCISPNGEMQDTEPGRVYHETVTPLPDNKPDNKQITPYSPPEGDRPRRESVKRREAREAPAWKPERFAGFWRLYPLKKSKQAAIRAWDRLHPDDALIAAMGRALQRQMGGEDWQRGFGIPYPATWLNNRRWEDEEAPRPAGAPHSGRVIEEAGTYEL